MNSFLRGVIVLIFSVTLTIFLIECGGGGGGGGNGDTSTNSGPLVISNLSYELQNGKTYADALIHITFDFKTINDISSVTITFLNGKMNQISSRTSSVQGISGIKTGYITWGFYLPSNFFDTLTIEIQATDTKAVTSNTISKTFEVYGGFGNAFNYPYNSNYYDGGKTAIGDLNGDNKNDVAVIQSGNNTGLVQIFYQDSTGKLNNPIELTTNIYTRGLAIKDINNDGRDDLILSGMSKSARMGELGRIVVYKQDPASGQLMTPIEYTVSSNSAGSLEIADLNSDGLNDIAAISPNIGSPGNLSIFFQDSNGGLYPEVVYNNLFVRFTGEIHIADMDNDGDNDIVLQSDLKQLAVIKQISPGQFSNVPDTYDVVVNSWPNFDSFALGDVNGDGLNDIVVLAPGTTSYLNIFLQNSGRTFDAPTLIKSECISFGIEIYDITRDGLNDIIGDSSGHVCVYPQNKNNSFGNYHYYSYPSVSYGGSVVHEALSIGDVTGDGLPDAVLTWSDKGLFVLPFYPQIS